MVSQEQKVSSAFDWNVIENHGFSTLSFSETLAGGQSFVWEQDKSGTWNGVISNAVISLRLDNELLKWKSSEQSFGKTELMNYLWLGPSYSIAIDTLPWRSDPILERSIKLLSGLRILRQPVGETLFYFLLSPVKSIPQIREIGSKVAKLLGPTLALGKFGFPGWSKLCQVSENEFREMKFGYRAKNIVGVASFIKQNPNFLENLKDLGYKEAKYEIMKLPGVGPKVADCVLLYGLGKLDAFPVDTWIEKTLDERYHLNGWKTENKLHFAQKHFGKYAGLAQQFLFSSERLGLHEKG